MNTSFDWSLLPTFLAALERGSLLGAARQLGISQPTAGRHIADLESQLGKVLFERTGRGLRPTALALELAGPARAMQSGALALAERLLDTQGQQAGTVRLSASQPVACHLLPAILVQMRQALPAIQIELVVSNQVSNLLQREADIALRMVQPAQASLVARRIAQVSLSACASAAYLARRGTPLVPDELPGHELIGYDQHDELLRGFAAMGHPVTREHFALRTDDLIATWEAVRAGLGVGFVADYVIATDPAVQRILPMLPLPRLPVWLTVHREIRNSGRIRAVYDFLAQAVPQALPHPDPNQGTPA
jgi:DNA-binding transcriptional LysR family regulator